MNTGAADMTHLLYFARHMTVCHSVAARRADSLIGMNAARWFLMHHKERD